MPSERKTREIRVTAELIGSLRKPGQEAVQTLALPAPATAETLLARLGIAPHHQRFVQVVLDGEVLDADAPLKNGMNLKLFIPVGGG